MEAEEFFLTILDSKECKNAFYRRQSIDDRMFFFFEPSTGKFDFDVYFIDFKTYLLSYLKETDISYLKLLEYMAANDETNLIPLIFGGLYTERNKEPDMNYFITILEVYILDNLLQGRSSIKDIVKDEEFLYPTRNCMSLINGAVFKQDGLLFDGKAYYYNQYINKQPEELSDSVPGFAKIISELKGDFDLLYRLDERLSLSIQDYFDYTGAKFGKVRGPQFSFSNKLIHARKTIIVHQDDDTNDKLVMVVKKIPKEKEGEEFWHVQLETIPYPATKKDQVTTFLHGLYYPSQKIFTHIDCTKNEYSYELYEKKYRDCSGDIAIDAYTETNGQHYKLWCIENGCFQIETWYKLFFLSLTNEYQLLFNEMLEIEGEEV